MPPTTTTKFIPAATTAPTKENIKNYNSSIRQLIHNKNNKQNIPASATARNKTKQNFQHYLKILDNSYKYVYSFFKFANHNSHQSQQNV